MADITEVEQQQIDRANASDRNPVVFVHGLWLLPSSWDRWRAMFEEAGYTTLAPAWPDDPETVEEANQHPEVFAHKTVGQVADHFEDVIGKLSGRPAIIVPVGAPARVPIRDRSVACCLSPSQRSSREHRCWGIPPTTGERCRSPSSSSATALRMP